MASERWASQASKPPAIAPESVRQRRRPSARSEPRTDTAPSRTSECPHRLLVPESIAKSAPWASGCWPSGVQTVLSTASSAPAAWAASAAAAMSTTSRRGFEGVSSHTSVAPSAAAAICAVGTRRVWMPSGSSRSAASPRIPG